MRDLSGFLQKFKLLIKDNRDERRVFEETVKQILGIDIGEESFSIKDNIITLKTSPTLRTEIYLRKEEALRVLKEKGSKITEVR